MDTKSPLLTRDWFIQFCFAITCFIIPNAHAKEFFNQGNPLLVDNPYANVEWNHVETLHSMSHQHTYGNAAIQEQLYQMGFRHFAISEYYPSKPAYPLPHNLKIRSDIIGAPNAEHHGATDYSFHFNTLGSFYTTGFGERIRFGDQDSIITHKFDDLMIFDADSAYPGEGVYRLDLRFEKAKEWEGESRIKLTVYGAEECDPVTFERINGGKIEERVLDGDFQGNVFLRVNESPVTLHLERDPETTNILLLRLMQGLNRPWRKAFSDALDGDRKNAHGDRIEGLLYPEGGGITINHPWSPSIDAYLEMLDFDERVLGVEVWNHRRWFGLESAEPHNRYYNHWDAILRTGRRCLGFFVKDHRQFGRGRNVLLVPPLENLSMREREREALRAYREGRFFGVLGATNIDERSKPVNPYDYTEFRFTLIELDYDEKNNPSSVHIAVTGHDKSRRPNLQLRFITDQGLAEVINNRAEATFQLPTSKKGDVIIRYLRVEAYAYPNKHKTNKPLNPEEFGSLNVYEIARLHDQLGDADWNDVDDSGQEPIPIVDMIFSQPIRFIYN